MANVEDGTHVSAPDAVRPVPPLARLARGDLDTGCGVAAAIAPGRIVMQTNAAGHLRSCQVGPVSAEESALIARVCPGLGQSVAAAGRTDHPLWGPYVAMHTGHATDAELRHRGASGGGVSGIAAWLLRTGRVDAVLQVRADPDRPVGNVTTLSRSRADILAAAGSRYAPAAPVAEIAALLDTGERFAFVGKPCDVAAVRAWAAEDPRVAARFPIVLSFFCAGTPSLSGADAVIRALDAEPAEATAFRYRGQGWPGRATVTLKGGEERSMSYHDSWGKILSKHVQHRCKICADGTGTAADIVCADAWESDANGYPVFDEAEGTSLFVARTALGAELLAAAEADGDLVLGPFDVETLAAMQPGQTNRRRALLARLAALWLLGRPVPRYRGLKLWAAARQAPLRYHARNFLGTLRRGLRQRRQG